jgi:hypothetical protein
MLFGINLTGTLVYVLLMNTYGFLIGIGVLILGTVFSFLATLIVGVTVLYVINALMVIWDWLLRWAYDREN